MPISKIHKTKKKTKGKVNVQHQNESTLYSLKAMADINQAHLRGVNPLCGADVQLLLAL